MPSPTVLISGLGTGGPTLAYWLNRFGRTPTVVERAPALERDGYPIEELRLVDRNGRRITGVNARVFARAGSAVRELAARRSGAPSL